MQYLSQLFFYSKTLTQIVTSIQTVCKPRNYITPWFFPIPLTLIILLILFACLIASTECWSSQTAVYDDFKASSWVTIAILTFSLLESHRVSASLTPAAGFHYQCSVYISEYMPPTASLPPPHWNSFPCSEQLNFSGIILHYNSWDYHSHT